MFSQKRASVLLLFIVAAALAPHTLAARDDGLDSPSGAGHLAADGESHVRVDPAKSVVMLNRVNFNASVAQEHVDHWIVLFCVDWYEVCQGLWHNYRNTAAHYEQVLSNSASSWQTTAVRFAEVSCESDKALCNENGVQMYPSVLHFQGGKFKTEWEMSETTFNKGVSGISVQLSRWIGKELIVKNTNATTKASKTKSDKAAAGGGLSVALHLRELQKLLSWKSLWEDPATAAFGYCLLIVACLLFVWIVGTGLELEPKSTLKSTLSWFSKEGNGKSWPSALLPALPEMPVPRTIVRKSLEL